MQLIKLDATTSTNHYLKQLALQNHLKDYTVTITQKQTHGRGQTGAKWISEEGKNLTFSVLKIFENFKAIDQVYLNCAVSLALADALKELSVPDLRVKWPNDIMSGNHKICGILIENILQGNKVSKSIIGIGLNVNQIRFSGLQNVSSLQLLLGKTLDLEILMKRIITKLKIRLGVLETPEIKSLKVAYEEVLFRKDKPSTFIGKSDIMFIGIIKGLSDDGKLVIQTEDKQLKKFAVKEVKLLY
ncbi:biotin--[acetyl-CoA-carboxylase] ligase [Croceitalea rosinachiae]|uniref:Biotin--[acetyl-CoA-carboxylase] ligase n=1 Tax=Croceitalea rosinachiae TaxID=3075596 RepID=A0ABU3AEH6_9FLAO|nr:biotin--[acetyl-CoA-carboxylase] ligase [Croceitalea sp. F388]MDT0608399.1 biotin--[acetyl-CoA-carboxylase] ligase [Croceitalea sp. F388]